MRHFSNQDLLIIGGLAAAALLVGSLIDQVAWCAFAAAVGWSLLQRVGLARFARWSKKPLRRPENKLDTWYRVTNPAYQYAKRERRRSRGFLQRLRELSTLSDSIPDAVILVSAVGEIQDFNPAAQKLLRLTSQDRGLGLATVVRQPDFVRFLRDGTDDEPIELRSPFDAKRTLEARRFYVDGERIKLLNSTVTEDSDAPGTHLGDFRIACGTGAVQITKAQRQGKRPMDAQDILRGMTLPDHLP